MDGRVGEQRPGRLDAVENGHPDIHEHHVRTELSGQVERTRAVRSLGDHLEVGLGVEDHPEPGPYQRLVVGDQQPADRVRHAGVGAIGSVASTRNDPSDLGAARTVPP